MMKRQYDYLIKEIDLIDNAINELEKKVFVVNGNFEADDRNGQTYCYLRTGIGKKRHRRYLGTKTAEIAKLYKTNEIKNRLLTSLKEDKGALEMCVDSLSAFSSDELVSQLPKAFKKIKVNDFGDERLKDIFKWAAAPHQKNDKSFPDAKIYAADGQRVRSKGECLWYNLLLEAGIPFVYDVVIELKNEDGLIVTYQKNAGTTDNKVIIPQFFIDRNGRQLYMEVYKEKIIIKPIGKENKDGTKEDV